jgi:AhpD family alkylhydroperoxidase
MKGFKKKIYTGRLFFTDIGFLLYNIPLIPGALRNKKISKAFAEKIMLVTTAVNGCVYCEWFHAKKAAEEGIPKSEIKNMLNLQFRADASDFELPGLSYAQHYAETNRQPDAEMNDKLCAFYGDKTAKHIRLFIRMIFFGNLSGNTWDAIMSRLKGKPADKSNILFEIVFFILTFWLMFPLMFFVKNSDKAIA